MGEIKKLREICKAFKLGRFGIEEFKARIETVYLPGEYKNTLEKAQHNTVTDWKKLFIAMRNPKKICRRGGGRTASGVGEGEIESGN